jgi:iron complex transport system substrate-binding protein
VLASVPYRLESLAAILKCGVPVLTLAPHSLADIYQDIRLLGAILQVPDRAEAVIEEMLSALATAKRAAADAPEEPLVYCEEWGKPLIHSQTWVSELVATAGGRFLGTPGSVTDAAAVAAQDPDVLVFAWCGAGDRVPSLASSKAAMAVDARGARWPRLLHPGRVLEYARTQPSARTPRARGRHSSGDFWRRAKHPLPAARRSCGANV